MLLRNRVAFFISHVICCWWCRRVRSQIYRIIRTLKSKSKIRVLDFDISLQIKKNMSYILYFIRQNTCTWLHNLVKLDHITWHATEPREQFDGTYRLYKQLEPREQTGTWFWAAAAICGWELGMPTDRPPRNTAWTRRWCVRGQGSEAVHIALSVT